MTLALRVDAGDAVAETESSEREQKGAAARVLPFPYARLVRAHVEKEHIAGARDLLQLGLQQPNPDPALFRWRRVLAPARVRLSAEKGSDRSREIKWLHENAAKYRGLWVAVLGDQLLASASTIGELHAKLKEVPPPRPPLAFRFSDE